MEITEVDKLKANKSLKTAENIIMLVTAIASIAGMVLTFVLVNVGVMDRIVLPIVTCISSITGVVSSVYLGRFSILGQWLMLVSVILFGAAALWFGWWGLAIYYLLFRAPYTISAIVKWKNSTLHPDKSKQLTKKNWLVTSGLVVAGTILIGAALWLLNYLLSANVLNASYEAITSLTGSAIFAAGLEALMIVLQITALILTKKMYDETWIFWMIANAVSIAIWTVTTILLGDDGFSGIIIIIMSIGFFATNVTGIYRWKKDI